MSEKQNFIFLAAVILSVRRLQPYIEDPMKPDMAFALKINTAVGKSIEIAEIIWEKVGVELAKNIAKSKQQNSTNHKTS
jgi:hypothetical protein